MIVRIIYRDKGCDIGIGNGTLEDARHQERKVINLNSVIVWLLYARDALKQGRARAAGQDVGYALRRLAGKELLP